MLVGKSSASGLRERCMIDWICLKCGRKLEVPDDRAGAEEPCPACGQFVQMPLTQVPIPPYPLTMTADGKIACPGDFTVGSPTDRAMKEEALSRYRLWRRWGMLIGLIPSLIVAAVLITLNIASQRSTDTSVLLLVVSSVAGLACAGAWGVYSVPAWGRSLADGLFLSALAREEPKLDYCENQLRCPRRHRGRARVWQPYR